MHRLMMVAPSSHYGTFRSIRRHVRRGPLLLLGLTVFFSFHTYWNGYFPESRYESGYYQESRNDFSEISETVSISAEQERVHSSQMPLESTFPFPRQDLHNLSHCYYRDYPKPDIHSGLPFVGEVFASQDHSVVYLAAEGLMNCQHKYRKAHNLFASDTRKGAQFNCIFEFDGTTVRSKPVHPIGKHKSGGFFILMECPVPAHLQHTLPAAGSPWTSAHLTLEALVDLHDKRLLVSNDTTHTVNLTHHRLEHLPICSHAWPTEAMYNPVNPQVYSSSSHDTTMVSKKAGPRRQLSLMTRISTSYRRGTGTHEQLTLSVHDFVPWMEYHLALGFEHVYIFDDSPSPFTSRIRRWCEPYRQQGVLTYIHYPHEDVQCNTLMAMGKDFYAGQVLSGNAALRRYQSETVWMANWDVDEYLTIPGVTNHSTLLAFVHQQTQQGQDNIVLNRPTYGPCPASKQTRNASVSFSSTKNESLVPATNTSWQPPYVTRKCYRPHDSKGKGILRTDTVLIFRVHYAQMRVDHTLPNKTFVATNHGHIAHFRNGQAAGKHFGISSRRFEHQEWMKPLPHRVTQRLQQLGEMEKGERLTYFTFAAHLH